MKRVSKKLLAILLASVCLTRPVFSDEPIILDTEPIDPSIITSEQDKLKTSLLKEMPEIFCRKNLCNIDTVGDPDGTHITLFNPELSIIQSYTCKKDKKRKERGLWKVKVGEQEKPGIQVTRSTKRIYGVRLKIDNKFQGYRDKAIGIMLEKILGLSKKYNGTLLIDEYKNYPLWNVALKDREELLDFLEYVTTANMVKTRTPYFMGKKPVLRLTLQDDPFLERLELEDFALLNTLFTVVDYRDSDVTKFFNDTLVEMSTITLQFEASGPIHLGESVPQHILRQLEGYFKDFDASDMASKFLVIGLGGVTAWLIWKKGIKPVLALIDGKVQDLPTALGWTSKKKTK